MLLPLARLRQLDLVDVKSLGNGLGWCPRRKGGFESRDEGRIYRIGEDDVELDVEVSELVMSEGRHSLARDSLEVIWGVGRERKTRERRGQRLEIRDRGARELDEEVGKTSHQA